MLRKSPRRPRTKRNGTRASRRTPRPTPTRTWWTCRPPCGAWRTEGRCWTPYASIELAVNPASAAPVSAAVPAGTAHAPETPSCARLSRSSPSPARISRSARRWTPRRCGSRSWPSRCAPTAASDSHKVAIIHDQDGLACVVQGAVPGLKPPCVIQEYVNHGGCLFKVYVVGDDVTMTRRKSLPDLRGARASRRRRAAAEKAAACSPPRAGTGIFRLRARRRPATRAARSPGSRASPAAARRTTPRTWTATWMTARRTWTTTKARRARRATARCGGAGAPRARRAFPACLVSGAAPPRARRLGATV